MKMEPHSSYCILTWQRSSTKTEIEELQFKRKKTGLGGDKSSGTGCPEGL